MTPETLARVCTQRGELALRRHDGRFEIISNGVFLMDTSDGRSERLLVRAALDAFGGSAPGVLIGGLGVGFSVAEAVADPAVASVTVVEIEPDLLDWHTTFLYEVSGPVLADPRVSVVCADLLAWLPAGTDRYDVVCLDVDNGPHWTVSESNAGLYSVDGLRMVHDRLAPAGVLAVWSAAADSAYEQRLRGEFRTVEVLTVEVARGEPDVVYLAR